MKDDPSPPRPAPISSLRSSSASTASNLLATPSPNLETLPNLTNLAPTDTANLPIQTNVLHATKKLDQLALETSCSSSHDKLNKSATLLWTPPQLPPTSPLLNPHLPNVATSPPVISNPSKSDFERLLLVLNKETRRREEAEKEKDQAEKEKDQAEKRQQEETRRREQAEQRQQEERRRREEAEQRQQEERRRREQAEQRQQEETRRREEAEQRAERDTTVKELADYLDRLLLNDLNNLVDPKHPLMLGKSVTSATPTSGKSTRKHIIPDQLCYDHATQAGVAQLHSILDALGGHLTVKNITPSYLATIRSVHTSLQTDPKLEKSLETCWMSLFAPVLKAILEEIDAIVAARRATDDLLESNTSSAAIDKLVDMFPHIPWGTLEGKCHWDFHSPKQNATSTQTGQLASIRESEIEHHTTTTTIPDQAQPPSPASTQSSKKPKAESDGASKSRSKSGSQSQSKQPSSEYGRVRSDIFTTVQTDKDELRLAYITKVKAFNATNSEKIERFFRTKGLADPRQDDNDAAASSDGRYGSILLVDKSRVATANLDHEVTAVLRQCFGYIRAHECPFILLPTGLTFAFLRYDHKARMQSLANLHPDHSPPQIQLHYYLVSRYPLSKDDQDDKEQQAKAACQWRQKHPLLDALLFALLDGLNGFFGSTDDERREWLQDLDENAYVLAPRKQDDQTHPPLRSKSSRDSDDGQGARSGRGSQVGAKSGKGRPAANRTVGEADHGSSRGGDGRDKGGSEAAKEACGMRRVLGEIDTNANMGRGFGQRHQQQQQPRAKAVPTKAQASKTRQRRGDKQQHRQQHHHSDHAVVVEDSNFEHDGAPRYVLRYPDLITRHWCTPQCLLGLKYGLAMDPNCPNVALHCTEKGCTDHGAHKHPRTLEHIKVEMQAELREGHIWKTMEPIVGRNGLHAQLFRFLHHELGYAFAAKGTHAEFGDRLEREHKMYERIWNHTRRQANESNSSSFPTILSLSGKNKRRAPVRVHIPVSCGIVEPSRENIGTIYPLQPVEGQFDDDYPYNMWLLLSYHSLNMNREPSQQALARSLGYKLAETKDLVETVTGACDQALLLKWGICHNDLHRGNMLWCDELNAIVLIDFERAYYTQPLPPKPLRTAHKSAHLANPTPSYCQ